MRSNIKSRLSISLIIFSFFSLSSQNNENENRNKLKQIVYTLADDSMLGRAAGGAGEEKAKKYLAEYFKKIGLTQFNGSYIHKFTFLKDSVTTDNASNVIGFINNKKDSTIIIGAHYDHIGLGGPKSRSFTNNKIHNGADDNASGVSVMLMLAEYFNKSAVGNRQSAIKKYNYLFIAFSAHENGLYGSQAFITEKKYNCNKVKLIINFDMVGRLDTSNPILKVIRNDENNYLDTLLNEAADGQFKIIITDDNIDHSDATVFINNHITAVSLTTGTHEDYHKVTDDAQKINYEGLLKISEYVKRFISEYSNSQMNFQKQKSNSTTKEVVRSTEKP